MRVARHRLDDRTRDLLGKEIAERVAASELDSDKDQAVLASIGGYVLNHFLPGEILQGLKLFCATGAHALVLSNLPTQEYPASPVTGFAQETDLALTNALHFGLIRLLGVTPFAVDYENNGRLIRNVVPNPLISGVTSSWGADAEFFWHTDNPHLRFGEPGTDPRLHVPRYLTFFAVRNDEQVPTEIAAVEDAVSRLDDETQRALQSPSYAVGPPASNDGGHALSGASVLEQSVDGHRVRYDRGTVQGRSAGAIDVLDTWSAALTGIPAEELTLESGEFLIFDNYRVLHRRRAFAPGPDAAARWLRRCYAS
ncbi:MAG: TauD/TfdA family dioxygenase [Micromonosporaceae bacterium]